MIDRHVENAVILYSKGKVHQKVKLLEELLENVQKAIKAKKRMLYLAKR
jgi:hypothetical protein